MSAIHSTYRTAESVSPGHPDKICDQISDAILDAYLAHDQKARVAVEACGGHGTVFLTGEVSSTVHVDPVPIVQRLAGEVEVINRITKWDGLQICYLVKRLTRFRGRSQKNIACGTWMTGACQMWASSI